MRKLILVSKILYNTVYLYLFLICLQTLIMYTRIQNVDVDIFNLPARLLITGFQTLEKSFFYFISRLLRKYKTYFNQIIVIGSDLQNCEDLPIELDDTFNPLIDAFEGSILVIYNYIILNEKLISNAADIFVGVDI